MQVRAAVRSDEPWVRSLIPRLHEFGPPAHRPVAVMNDAEATATAAAIEGGADRTVLIAVDDDGTRLGFVHLETAIDFFTHERHGHVSTLVVDSAGEKRGLGRALLQAAERWARERGYRLLTLNVFEGNAAARRLYARAGFTVDTIKYVKLLG